MRALPFPARPNPATPAPTYELLLRFGVRPRTSSYSVSAFAHAVQAGAPDAALDPPPAPTTDPQRAPATYQLPLRATLHHADRTDAHRRSTQQTTRASGPRPTAGAGDVPAPAPPNAPPHGPDGGAQTRTEHTTRADNRPTAHASDLPAPAPHDARPTTDPSDVPAPAPRDGRPRMRTDAALNTPPAPTTDLRRSQATYQHPLRTTLHHADRTGAPRRSTRHTTHAENPPRAGAGDVPATAPCDARPRGPGGCARTLHSTDHLRRVRPAAAGAPGRTNGTGPAHCTGHMRATAPRASPT
ncbi:hypothetical protein FB475_3639 [Kribbella jejuensis]|uniref:Uncharacterized protein n=1 Tax=Kribbella jejuensis TaxID=236068 RepID=A0A542EVT1_9ACTN|nr:hypothetical protein FB475_3639 [Kribbella jejuensis]